MKHLRSFIYLSVVLLTLLAACAPKTAPSGTPPDDIVPLTGGTPQATGVLIQHQAVPGQLPDVRSSHAGDQDSSIDANKKRAPGGDRFTFGQFERPFNADTMDVYFPYLDIQDAAIYQDDTWVYALITVKGPDADGKLPGRYAVEVDLNADGRGDWLVLVSHPSSTDWTTDGVQVWMDGNGDVGGDTIVNADKQTSGDGYETLAFDQGQGSDPDAAWARISPDDPNTVELAAKRSLLRGDTAYLAGMWAGNEDLNPALFDLNDHFTHEQAGEAMPELEYYYPIKQISELDNTCRMAIGFQAKGNEPHVCAVPGAPGPEGCQPPPSGCNVNNGFHWDPKLCCCNYENLGCNYSP
jgi:hypothetical protein